MRFGVRFNVTVTVRFDVTVRFRLSQGVKARGLELGSELRVGLVSGQ